MKRFILCVLIAFWTSGLSVVAQDKAQTFIVGVEKIDYYPHYNFQHGSDKGYAWALLEAFAEAHNYKFVYQPLPVARLKRELTKGTVDFAYPDNAKWHHDESPHKAYSKPLTIAMGGTMVRKDWLPGTLDRFESLSVPRGFTPVKWLELAKNNKVTLVEVNDSRAALELVLKGRVTGADIEYHVAKNLLTIMNQADTLALAPSLPYDTVGFSLSSNQHPEVVESLSAFIESNPTFITHLKSRYGLQEPQDILKGKAAHSK
ncbi:transporter substrate-binding domain-containing protein [Aestuariibacter sp. AA17]|uniref:Transporter substrate-binding domain-containing protein n=1 Tax=Fluctibacter corallii TaxID=2984329 RepID=A0ABT3ACW3_9ALTE|nr:transporter substrate-binding domain-containing protein [Aestuariibacter sp. AA17]MCV2886512.1 transporter substrate-binding domain-containing protein [Aestuariibacter sp. AA17]